MRCFLQRRGTGYFHSNLHHVVVRASGPTVARDRSGQGSFDGGVVGVRGVGVGLRHMNRSLLREVARMASVCPRGA